MESWWSEAERWASVPEGAPPGIGWRATAATVLREALDVDRLDVAREGLETLRTDPEIPGQTATAIALLVALRETAPDLEAIAERATALATTAPPDTAARAWHVAAMAHAYRGDAEASLDALLAGLEQVEPDAPRRYWMLGTASGLMIAQGAWTEARALLDTIAAYRVRVNDVLGIAITAGRQATLELGTCNPGAALAAIERARERVWNDIPPISRLRLAALGLTAADELGRDTETWRALVEEGVNASRPGHLRGTAALALVRSEPDGDRVRAWLDVASDALRDPDGRARVAAWTEHLLDPDTLPEPSATLSYDGAGWGAFTQAMLRCERAMKRDDRPLALRWLDRAEALAVQTNAPAWMSRVDERARMLDPVRAASRSAQRFSGLPAHVLDQTTQDVVTIVFVDLVGFTDRSQHLSPEAVMDTVRSLFELAVPVLAAHRVRPLQYLGDGLLAVAQGDGHVERGRAFALGLVHRCGQMSALRRARGDALPLTTRAGVATGPVVLGLVGSFAKLEHLAIGRTTNLAARLQGQAAPGEVVWAVQPGEPESETVALKGFTRPVSIVRQSVDPR